jgi:hypothetical protein
MALSDIIGLHNPCGADDTVTRPSSPIARARTSALSFASMTRSSVMRCRVLAADPANCSTSI